MGNKKRLLDYANSVGLFTKDGSLELAKIGFAVEVSEYQAVSVESMPDSYRLAGLLAAWGTSEFGLRSVVVGGKWQPLRYASEVATAAGVCSVLYEMAVHHDRIAGCGKGALCIAVGEVGPDALRTISGSYMSGAKVVRIGARSQYQIDPWTTATNVIQVEDACLIELFTKQSIAA